MADLLFSQIAQLVLFVFPAYVANSVPVVLGGGATVDFGTRFVDGRRFLGEGKTIRGFVAGVVAGTLVGLVYSTSKVDVLGVSEPGAKITLAFLLSFGALAGDLLGSFVKRRLEISEGEPFFVTDQLLFLVVALLLAFAYRPELAMRIGLLGTAFLVLFTFAAHLFFNWLAHGLKLKKVPW